MQLLVLATSLANAAQPVAHLEERKLHVGTGYSNGGHVGMAMERQRGSSNYTWAWCAGPVGGGVWGRRYWGLLPTGSLSVFLESGLGARAGLIGIGFGHASGGLQYFPADGSIGVEAYAGYSTGLYWNVEQSTSVLDYFYTFPQAGFSIVVSLDHGRVAVEPESVPQ